VSVSKQGRCGGGRYKDLLTLFLGTLRGGGARERVAFLTAAVYIDALKDEPLHRLHHQHQQRFYGGPLV